MGKLTKKINRNNDVVDDLMYDDSKMNRGAKIIIAIIVSFLIISLAFYGFAL